MIGIPTISIDCFEDGGGGGGVESSLEAPSFESIPKNDSTFANIDSLLGESFSLDGVSSANPVAHQMVASQPSTAFAILI